MEKQYVVVHIEEEQFGIHILDVENIVKMQAITRVPMTPSYIKGVINLRGEIVPILSPRLRMGLANDEYSQDSRIIILNLKDAGLLGLVVDEVKEVVTFVPEEVDKKFIKAIGKHHGELVSVLDLKSILSGMVEQEAV